MQYETKYKVTTVIQSRATENGVLSNPPMEVSWYGHHAAGPDNNLGQAIAAAVQAMAHDESMNDGNLPDSMRYDTLKVTFERIITPVEDEPHAIKDGDPLCKASRGCVVCDQLRANMKQDREV